MTLRIAGLTVLPLTAAREDATTAVRPPMTQIPGLKTQSQGGQKEWCWAAVTSTVSKFYDSGSKWSQCVIVCKALADSGCCKQPSSDACDVPWDLDKALTMTGNLEGSEIDDQISPAALVEQMSRSAPVAIRIAWANGRGHFVLVCAASDDGHGNGTVHISDPIYGESVHTITELDGNYLNGDGQWTDTYMTKA